jgi:hypothetical protein
MPGENDYVLFYRASPTGARAVGYVNGAGAFVQTKPEKACHNWESIVRVGTNLLFYGVQNGVMEIGHVDDDGQLVVTQTSQASPNWWPIVGVEPDGPSYGTSNVVFYNDTGVIELGYIDHDGHLAQPTPQAFPFEPNCDYATTVGPCCCSTARSAACCRSSAPRRTALGSLAGKAKPSQRHSII